MSLNGNNISDILPENILKVMIKQSGDTVRIVEIEAKAQQYINLLKRLTYEDNDN